MDKQVNRRSVLATASCITGISLAGCVGMEGRQIESQWEEQDVYPDDDTRNRECNENRMGDTTGLIGLIPNDRGYRPFAYSLSGRGNLHGTDEHVEMEIVADDEVDIYVSVDPDAGTNHVEVLWDYSREEKQEMDELPLGFDALEEHTGKGTTNHTISVTIPDDETYSVVVIPSEGSPDTDHGNISLEISFNCSYYLPLDEYRDILTSD